MGGHEKIQRLGVNLSQSPNRIFLLNIQASFTNNRLYTVDKGHMETFLWLSGALKQPFISQDSLASVALKTQSCFPVTC